MISDYINRQLAHARYKLLDDQTYFGEIAGLPGVWANARHLEDCRRNLQEVLEDWLVLKLRDGDSIPGFKIHSAKTPTYA